MHYYTVSPIAMKLWSVVEYNPANVYDNISYDTIGKRLRLGRPNRAGQSLVIKQLKINK